MIFYNITNYTIFDHTMQGIILLDYAENVRQVEEEEKTKFLMSLLEQMGVPIDFWDGSIPLSVDQKIKLRTILAKNNASVIDNAEGLKIYVGHNLFGEFYKSTYKLKKDLSQLDPKKQIFTEMTINFWTIFEEKQKE